MDRLYDQRRFYGRYRAIVVDNRDPTFSKRVKLQVASPGGDTVTDWAKPVGEFYGSSGETGSVFIPEIGSGVWAEFEQGNPKLPLYSPGWNGSPNGINEVPRRFRGLDDEIVASKGNLSVETLPYRNKDNEPELDNDEPLEIIEPSSPFQGVYPHVRGFKTGRGHLFEYDDTPDEERILFYHKQGSYVEFRKDGDLAIKSKKRLDWIEGESINVIEKHHTQFIGKSQDISVGGDKKEVVRGLSRTEYRDDRREIIRGNYEHFVKGNKEDTVRGKTNSVFNGPVSEKYTSSLTCNISSQFEKVVLQTVYESIANEQFSEVAKALDILYGDYEVTIVTGNEEHFLSLGDVEWTLLIGDESHLLEYGDVNWTLLLGDWNTSIIVGDENHSILTGDYNYDIVVGNESHTIAIGNKSQNIIAGNDYIGISAGNIDRTVNVGNVTWSVNVGTETHSISVGDFIVGLLQGNISLTTANGNITISASSGGSISLSAATGSLSGIGMLMDMALQTSSSITAGTSASMTGANSSVALMAGLAVMTAVEIHLTGIVRLGGPAAIHPLLFADTVISIFNSHVHPGVLSGPSVTGSPTTTLTPGVDSSFVSFTA